MQINHKREHDPFLNLTGDIGGPPQALLLSVCRADLYTCIYKRSEGSLSVVAESYDGSREFYVN